MAFLSFRHKWRIARPVYLKVAVDGAAATVTAETPFHVARTRETLVRVQYLPAAALTAHDTNFATLKLWKRTADGVTQTSMGTMATTTTGTGTWVAFVAEEMTLALTSLKAGESLLFEITKDGSGVAVPAGTLVVEAEIN